MHALGATQFKLSNEFEIVLNRAECDDSAVTFKYASATIFYSESPPLGRFARGTAPAASEQACIAACIAHPACAVIEYTPAFPLCVSML